MMLGQMKDDRQVFAQATNVAHRQHQIEMVSAVRLLDHSELAIMVFASRCI